MRRAFVLLAALPVALLACESEPSAGDESPIDREAFVSTYVDLRKATTARLGRPLEPHVRDSILSAHAVSEEDLLRFVEVHGRDVDFMMAVWDTIEARMLGAEVDGPPADTSEEPARPEGDGSVQAPDTSRAVGGER